MIKGVAFPPEPIVSNDLKAGAEGDGSRGMGKEGGPREKRIEICSYRAQYFQTKKSHRSIYNCHRISVQNTLRSPIN